MYIIKKYYSNQPSIAPAAVDELAGKSAVAGLSAAPATPYWAPVF